MRFWKWCLCLLICLGATDFLGAQSPGAVALRDSVNSLNNRGEYEQSQILIFKFLQRQDITEDDRFHAHLYMSFTYKRLFEYPSVFRFLDSAAVHAAKAAEPKRLGAMVKCQRALAQFDIQHYDIADSIMRDLSRGGMELLDDEHQAKMLMQQGYLRFLAKDYVTTDSIYERAVEMFRRASPCDLPMMYGKQLQLYGATNDDQRLRATYEISLASADSCGIVKYRMYTLQMMSLALESAGRHKEALEYTYLMLDQQQSYQQAEHLKNLAELDGLYKVAVREKEIAEQREVIGQQRMERVFLLGAITVLALVIMLFWVRQRALLRNKSMHLKYTRELFESIEQERKRISADLHDRVGHRLLMVRRDLVVPEQRQQVDASLDDIRLICRNLHPALFETVGLSMALESLVERMQQQFDVVISLEMEYHETLSTHSELQLYRIIQEALSNVVRHSGAVAAKVQVVSQPHWVRAWVMDSGKGFKVRETLASGKVFGLNTMLLRCRALGGDGHFHSEPGKTILEIQLPANQ